MTSILDTDHFKLGLFSSNCSGGLAVTTVPERWSASWADNLRLARLADLIERTGVTTVFAETLVSPATAETLATELGLRTAVLDPIEGLTDETSGEDYLSLMRRNLVALREANQCR